MRVIPVLDLQAGHVVRGVGGYRQDYRPIVSPLSASSRPIDVAQAFRQHFGFAELYVADLDAIAGAPPALNTYAELRAERFHLWLDAGVREAATAVTLAAAGIERVVVGLETVAGPATLQTACAQLGAEQVAFSLDLRQGVPLGETSTWDRPDAWSIAGQVIGLGVKHLILLDLARVGLSGGTGTADLCGRLAATYPEVQLVAGGGIRDLADVRRLQRCGVGAVLVATALHDGRIRPQGLAGL
jgi:phosphoribosylformimino-5-aminoimidazole carboxamide ribotide isomerase